MYSHCLANALRKFKLLVILSVGYNSGIGPFQGQHPPPAYNSDTSRQSNGLNWPITLTVPNLGTENLLTTYEGCIIHIELARKVWSGLGPASSFTLCLHFSLGFALFNMYTSMFPLPSRNISELRVSHRCALEEKAK
jgi:hypothetical protein